MKSNSVIVPKQPEFDPVKEARELFAADGNIEEFDKFLRTASDLVSREPAAAGMCKGEIYASIKNIDQ